MADGVDSAARPLENELNCPRCGYRLNMLTQPRCPECGLDFDWDELARIQLEASKWRPRFEYQWKTRPASSLAALALDCLLPWRLWTRVRLEYPPRERVILATVALALTGFALLFVLNYIVFYLWWDYDNNGRISGAWWPVWKSIAPSFAREDPARRWPILLALAASVAVFRRSFVRHAIRRGHLLRLVVYSWIGWNLWRFALEWTRVYVRMALDLCSYPVSPPLAWTRLFQWADIALAWVSLLLSLWLAYARYLKLPNAWLGALVTVLLSVFFLWFVVTVASLFWFESFNNSWVARSVDWVPGMRTLLLAW